MIKNILILFIVLVFGITLFLFKSNFKNSFELTEKKNIELVNKTNVTDSIKPTDKSLHKDIPTKSSSECISPLYVSDVLIDKQPFENQSLVNLLNYFDKIGANINQVKSILLNSGYYTSKEIRNSLLFFSPPAYATTSVDKTTLAANISEITSFGKNYSELAEAVKIGHIDPRMDLSYFFGQFRSIIDYFLEFRGNKPNASFFKTLIEAGVPVTHSTIIIASKPHVPTEILSILISNLDSNEREYKWREGVLGEPEYSYTSYASQFSSLSSLKAILSEQLGDKEDAINILLKAQLNPANKQNFFDLDDTIEKNKLLNDKLALLLEYDISVESDLIKILLPINHGISSKNIDLLVSREQTPAENNNKSLDRKREKEVNNYIYWLKKANKNWPEFIFSYDPECQKLVSNSHYRYDNLVNRDELTNVIKSSLTNSKKNILNELVKFGDIYVDWYHAVLAEDRKVKPYLNYKRISHKEIAYLIEEKLVTENWDYITKALKEEIIPLDYTYYNNNYLIELAVQNNSPQSILFEWYHIGVPIYNDSLSGLIYSEKYSDFTYFLIKKGKLTNKRKKTILFQLARSNNLKLLELLLNDNNSSDIIKYNNGISPLSWTLLNYNSSLKNQLELILSKVSTLSNSDRLLMTTIN